MAERGNSSFRRTHFVMNINAVEATKHVFCISFSAVIVYTIVSICCA